VLHRLPHAEIAHERQDTQQIAHANGWGRVGHSQTLVRRPPPRDEEGLIRKDSSQSRLR